MHFHHVRLRPPPAATGSCSRCGGRDHSRLDVLFLSRRCTAKGPWLQVTRLPFFCHPETSPLRKRVNCFLQTLKKRSRDERNHDCDQCPTAAVFLHSTYSFGQRGPLLPSNRIWLPGEAARRCWSHTPRSAPAAGRRTHAPHPTQRLRSTRGCFSFFTLPVESITSASST